MTIKGFAPSLKKSLGIGNIVLGREDFRHTFWKAGSQIQCLVELGWEVPCLYEVPAM